MRAAELLARAAPHAVLDADVALLCARAYTVLGNQPEASRMLGVLDQHRHPSGGWGLQYEWDAFSDGIVNPATTTYTYTTAAAIHAYVDYAESFSRPLPESVLDAAIVLTELWPYYDDHPNDHRADRIVHNVNALAIGAIYRLGHHGDHLLPAVLDAQGWDGKPSQQGVRIAAHCWPYSTAKHKPNDLFHEMLLLDGLRHIPTASTQVKRSLDGAWRTHLHNTGSPTLTTYTLGSLRWGPAAAAYMHAMQGQHERASTIIDNAITSNLWAACHPRALAWYALAMAAVLPR